MIADASTQHAAEHIHSPLDTRPNSWIITRLDPDLQLLDTCEIEAGGEGSPSVTSVLVGVPKPITAAIGRWEDVWSNSEDEGTGIEEGRGVCMEFVVYHANAREISTKSAARWTDFFDSEIFKIPIPYTLI